MNHLHLKPIKEYWQSITVLSNYKSEECGGDIVEILGNVCILKKNIVKIQKDGDKTSIIATNSILNTKINRTTESILRLIELNKSGLDVIQLLDELFEKYPTVDKEKIRNDTLLALKQLWRRGFLCWADNPFVERYSLPNSHYIYCEYVHDAKGFYRKNDMITLCAPELASDFFAPLQLSSIILNGFVNCFVIMLDGKTVCSLMHTIDDLNSVVHIKYLSIECGVSAKVVMEFIKWSFEKAYTNKHLVLPQKGIVTIKIPFEVGTQMYRFMEDIGFRTTGSLVYETKRSDWEMVTLTF